jgi:hypothetical protein
MGEALIKTGISLALDLVYCLLLALPVMWLTAFLHSQGWPITPLGYWSSYLTAFLLAWVIDGATTVRRAIETERGAT